MEYAGPYSGTPVTTNVDLYGLGRRAAATVLGTDYYGESSVADPTDSTRLQTNFLTTTSASGVTTTSVSGGTALLSYLNAQYASGAGAGQYVFLRLSSRAAMANNVRYLMTMADGAQPGPPDTRPRITYQTAANQPPTISSISNQTVPVNTPTGALAFTIGDDSTPVGSLMVTRSSSNTTLVPTANVVIGGSGANRTVSVTPTSNQTGTATITVQVSDGSLAVTSSFVVTVLANQAPTISAIADQSVLENTATAALAFTIADDSNPVGSLTVTRSSSNPTLVPVANLVLGGSGANRTLTATPASNQSGTAIITLQVSDGSFTTSTSFTLNVVRSLYGSASDADVENTPGTPPSYSVLSQASATLSAGTAGSGSLGKDRCAVIPFQLPDLGAVTNPFLTVSFTVNYASVTNNPSGNVLLYGLGARSAATVLTTDYWAATSDVDPTDATLMQTNLIVNGSRDYGLKTTDATGSAALLAWLNAQYAGGAGSGKYVFLRLSADVAQTAGSTRYNITSTDGAVAASNSTISPQITYFAHTPPVISDIPDQTLSVNGSSGAIAFTVGDSQTAASSLTLSKSSTNPTLMPTSGIVFGGSGSNRTLMLTPHSDRLGTSTVTMTVSDGVLSMSDTFVITVTGTASETWRFNNFGSSANSGFGADTFDANGDGESNLLEFGNGQDPNATTKASTPLVRNGANLELSYTRSKSVMADGILFAVEWRDTLATGIWSNAGVTEQILTDNGTVQTVKATCPTGTGGARFVHLSVSRP